MRQFLCLEQEYIALFCWLRRKKPCKRKDKVHQPNGTQDQTCSIKHGRRQTPRLTLQPSQVMTP